MVVVVKTKLGTGEEGPYTAFGSGLDVVSESCSERLRAIPHTSEGRCAVDSSRLSLANATALQLQLK